MRYLKFLPAIALLFVWLHVVASQVELKDAMRARLNSEQFIDGMSKAMDDPWNHVTALDLYFQKLQNDHANRFLWAASDAFSREFWNVFQCKASLQTRITVSLASGQIGQAKQYQSLYNALYAP